MDVNIVESRTIEETLREKAKRDKIVAYLLEMKQPFELVGGAVADIFYDKKPRDYDFSSTTTLNHNVLDLSYRYESSFSVAYSCKGEQLQILRKSTDKFPYKVQMIKICGDKEGNLSVKNMCEASLLGKRLIPNRSVCNSDFLQSLPKWIEKGFTIHRVEYYDALNRFLKSVDQELTAKSS